MNDDVVTKILSRLPTKADWSEDHGIDAGAFKFLSSSRVPPLSSSHHAAAAQPRPKHRGAQILSWLFPRTKKKAKPEMMSPSAIERENMLQLLKEWGLLSLDSLRRDLADANAHRDAALQEAAEMRSSLALMNQAMYQDFENCTFQKNGSPRCLDPKQDSQESFASFVALRNLSWNEQLVNLPPVDGDSGWNHLRPSACFYFHRPSDEYRVLCYRKGINYILSTSSGEPRRLGPVPHHQRRMCYTLCCVNVG
ncbi:hypothetical protein E2562_018015 [Oryza meyeriana var. granulata]|uniref:Uncharacterized protein n=1 Tax=Oryza meyeriana var. granulata TaxID=110450 RepID=A0A6G1C704_9ORYZ|nr:hypothetical protein E2562_018015 [Oryza meyeriana var. granulata]